MQTYISFGWTWQYMTLRNCERISQMAYKMWWQLFPAEVLLSCKLCINCTWPVKSKASGQTHNKPRPKTQLKMYFYYLCIIQRKDFKYLIEVMEVCMVNFKAFYLNQMLSKSFYDYQQVINILLKKYLTFTLALKNLYIFPNPTGSRRVQQKVHFPALAAYLYIQLVFLQNLFSTPDVVDCYTLSSRWQHYYI